MNKFYVYEHLRKDTGEVFYVGKGKHKRAWDKRKYNPFWTRVAAKGFEVRFVAENLSEEDSLRIEIETIQSHNSKGVKLCNLTEGGDGALSVLMSPEVRKKQKEAMGRPEVRGKISAVAKKQWLDPEYVKRNLLGREKNDGRIKKIIHERSGRVFRDSLEAGRVAFNELGLGKNPSSAAASIYGACKTGKTAYCETWRFA